MSRRTPALASLFTCFLSAALAQSGAPQAFKFTPVDAKLLEEVNELDRQLEKKGLVYQDPELTAYLNNVATRMLGDQPAPEQVNFKFRVLRDPMVNAFAMPNGSIYVHTGLLATLENEAQLASVLAHEITHVTQRHTYQHNRSLRKKMVAMHVFSAVSAAGGFFPAGSLFGAVLSVAGSVSQVLVAASVFGYSQDLERAADRNGVDLMTKGNYDARAMPRTFALLDEKLEIEPVETFWRTHPKLQERITTTTQLAGSQGLKEPRAVSEDAYLALVAGAMRYNIGADLVSRRARTALARANRLVRWKPDDPANRVLLADAYRALGAKTAEPGQEEQSRHGQADHRKRLLKLTAEEEQKELLKKPDGAVERKANAERAEKEYLESIAKDSSFAEAHRGLGMLYEEQSRNADAAREYKRYLDLAPADALDRLRIERRLEKLEKSLVDRGPAKPA